MRKSGQRRAAQYLRMSTEGQEYSTLNQAAAIAAYAQERDYQVVKTYSDLGISGLQLKNRRGLQSLIADALSGSAPFEIILVYDVSRWGRFQDPDQSAHYEFLCREAGLMVEYCAETFENDGSLSSTIMKSLRRVMAAEFSRDLGDKVLASQVRGASHGFKQGASPPYGLRRMMVDGSGLPIQALGVGEYKALRTDRVILVPGPIDEVRIVRRIFNFFVMAGMTRTAIAGVLNSEGVPTRTGLKWGQRTISTLLRNEAYAGDLVFNRTTYRLGQKKRANPPGAWVRRYGAYEPIIRRDVFEAAQRAMDGKFLHLTDEEMIHRLRELCAANGRLTDQMIEDAEGVPCSQTYRSRFGSLRRAYELAGYSGKRPLGGAVARRVAARNAREEPKNEGLR